MNFILLFENFNQSNSILKKLNKNQSDESFQKINSFVKTKGYIGLFTKLHFIDHISLDKLEHLNSRLEKLKNVINQLKNISGKNVDEYIDSTIEKLEDDLTILEETQSKKKIYNELPKSWKEILSNTTPVKRKLFDNLSKELGNSTEYKQLFRKLSRINNIDALINEMELLLDKIKGGLDYDSIKNKIHNLQKDNNAYIVYDKNNILISKIENFKASSILGSKSWCISTDQHYWNNYKNDDDEFLFNDIYFIWDFNKNSSDDLHQIGIVKKYKGFGSCHDMSDTSISVYDLAYFNEIENFLIFTTDDNTIQEKLKTLDETDSDNLSVFIKYGSLDNLTYFFEKNTFRINYILYLIINEKNIEKLKYIFTFLNKTKLNIDIKNVLDSVFGDVDDNIIDIFIEESNKYYNNGLAYDLYISKLKNGTNYTKIETLIKKLKEQYPNYRLKYIGFIIDDTIYDLLIKYRLDITIDKDVKEEFIFKSFDFEDREDIYYYLIRNILSQIDYNSPKFTNIQEFLKDNLEHKKYKLFEKLLKEYNDNILKFKEAFK